MYSAVQVGQPPGQPGFLLLPRHAVHTGRSLPLEGIVAVAQQIEREMVEQSRELLLFSFLRCLTHADQPLGHTNPALCRVRGGWAGVLLGPRASLPYLRRPLTAVVRQVHRYYHVVRLLEGVQGGRRALRFLLPICWSMIHRYLRGLPVLVQKVSRRAWVLRLRRVDGKLALAFPAVWPSAEVEQRRHPSCGFSEFNSPARRCPCLRFTGRLATTRARHGVRMARYSFPVRLLHSQLSAGSARRTDFIHLRTGEEKRTCKGRYAEGG